MNRIQNIEINENPFNNPEKYSKLIYDKAGQSESYKRPKATSMPPCKPPRVPCDKCGR